MSNRCRIAPLFVCLLAVLYFPGCRDKDDVTQSITNLELGSTGKKPAPLPTPEMLENLGPENDLDLQWIFPDTFYVAVGHPKKFFGSPIGQGNEEYLSSVVSAFLQVPFQYGNVRRFVHSFSTPAYLPVEIEERGAKVVKQGVFSRRITTLFFDTPTPREEWLVPFLAKSQTSAESIRRTIGSFEYYDLTPPEMRTLQKAVVHFPDDRTLVMIEGLEAEIKELFANRETRNAAVDRLKRMDAGSCDLLMVASREGVLIESELIDDLLAQHFMLPKEIALAASENFRSLMCSVNFEVPVGSPMVRIRYEALDEPGGREVGEQVRGQIVVAQTTLPSLSEAARQALPAPADFLRDALDSCVVSVDGPTVSLDFEKFERFEKTAVEGARRNQELLRHARTRQLKTEQLLFLAQAYAAHYQRHQKFPQTIRSADDAPLLSWRVSLLPTLGMADLYKQFNLREPWDGPTNKPLIEKIPPIFQPAEGDVEPGKTVIRTFVSEGTPLADANLKAENVQNPQTTLLFVSVLPAQAVEWTRPDELAFDIDRLESVTGPTFFGVTFLGQLVDMPMLPASDPQAAQQRQVITALVKGLPMLMLPQDATPPSAPPAPKPTPVSTENVEPPAD